MNPIRIAYIQGRPGPHPMHRKFAELVNSDFYFVDFRMRWQDKEKSILYRVISWFICALTFPSKKKYNIFLVDNLHFMPVLMKKLRLISTKQKIVAHMGSHTLYFIYAHKFSKLTELAHKWALKNYDALICEGEMAETLVKKILGNKNPKLYTIINGIPSEHFPKENKDSLPNNKNILFIGHVPDTDRIWYKGLDLMILAFSKAKIKDPELTFTIVGECSEFFISELQKNYLPEILTSVRFEKETPNLKKHLDNASLYLHCARGEAYGLTILIAMSYGLPTLVSEWTGAKEVVEQVEKKFVSPLDAEKIAEKILWYFQLTPEEKQTFSLKFKQTVQNYTEEKALTNFKEVFSKLKGDFNFLN